MRFVPAPQFDEVIEAATGDARADVAGEILKIARRTVNTDTGNYAKYLRVVTDERGVVAETTDYAGHIIEWGKEGQSPQAPIRTGATSVGRFEPA